MSSTEQRLACLHVDAVMLHHRLMLKLGLLDAASKVTAKEQRMHAALQRRDQQANIFGARTRKERRLDEAMLENAREVPRTAPVSAAAVAGCTWYSHGMANTSSAPICTCALLINAGQECMSHT